MDRARGLQKSFLHGLKQELTIPNDDKVFTALLSAMNGNKI